MKKVLFSLSLLLFSIPLFVQAQQRHGGGSQSIEAYRVAWITQKLDLSSEEAKIFWPIYNDYQREQNQLRQERMKEMISFRKITEIDELSDTEVLALITNELDFKQKDLNIDKKYYSKFKASLPIKTVGKFYRAQETFKKELLNRYRGGSRN